jgi:hypothetical protein
MEMQEEIQPKDDEDYTEEEISEIERNQQILQDGFEESMAECDRMLAVASSSDSAIELLSSQMASLNARLLQAEPRGGGGGGGAHPAGGTKDSSAAAATGRKPPRPGSAGRANVSAMRGVPQKQAQ